jgi:hypothetical protein
MFSWSALVFLISCSSSSEWSLSNLNGSHIDRGQHGFSLTKLLRTQDLELFWLSHCVSPRILNYICLQVAGLSSCNWTIGNLFMCNEVQEHNRSAYPPPEARLPWLHPPGQNGGDRAVPLNDLSLCGFYSDPTASPKEPGSWLLYMITIQRSCGYLRFQDLSRDASKVISRIYEHVHMHLCSTGHFAPDLVNKTVMFSKTIV